MDNLGNVHGDNTLKDVAPRPCTVSETGLSREFLCDLLAKHLYWGGVLNQQQLVERNGLVWSILDSVLSFMRAAGYVEVRSPLENSTLIRYALTEKGHHLALDAQLKSGYVGRAPVPLSLYAQVVQAQSVHDRVVTHRDMARVFKDVVIRESILNQLGPAMISDRPIFIYGLSGTGKTYVAMRLLDLLDDSVLIPFAVAIGDYTVQFFDPSIHHPQPIIKNESSEFILGTGYDSRFICCKRPNVITGGELSLDMLELAHDIPTRQYFAPLQMKANNGVYIVDDLGRQKVETADLLNRWIIPLELKLDYLTVGSGTRFPVPFDMVLIFSTNLNPLHLADEAFLRRLGYKVRFEPLIPSEYKLIWQQVCEQISIKFDEASFSHVLELYSQEDRPLLPCQPRDLLGLVADQCRYEGIANQVTVDRLNRAWNSYFISMAKTTDFGGSPSRQDASRRHIQSKPNFIFLDRRKEHVDR